MSNVKVSDLKEKLSAYLSEVRRGNTVVVYDRNTPIARIVPFEGECDDIIIADESAPPASLKQVKGVRPKKTGKGGIKPAVRKKLKIPYLDTLMEDRGDR